MPLYKPQFNPIVKDTHPVDATLKRPDSGAGPPQSQSADQMQNPLMKRRRLASGNMKWTVESVKVALKALQKYREEKNDYARSYTTRLPINICREVAARLTEQDQEMFQAVQGQTLKNTVNHWKRRREVWRAIEALPESKQAENGAWVLHQNSVQALENAFGEEHVSRVLELREKEFPFEEELADLSRVTLDGENRDSTPSATSRNGSEVLFAQALPAPSTVGSDTPPPPPAGASHVGPLQRGPLSPCSATSPSAPPAPSNGLPAQPAQPLSAALPPFKTTMHVAPAPGMTVMPAPSTGISAATTTVGAAVGGRAAINTSVRTSGVVSPSVATTFPPPPSGSSGPSIPMEKRLSVDLANDIAAYAQQSPRRNLYYLSQLLSELTDLSAVEHDHLLHRLSQDDALVDTVLFTSLHREKNQVLDYIRHAVNCRSIMSDPFRSRNVSRSSIGSSFSAI